MLILKKAVDVALKNYEVRNELSGKNLPIDLKHKIEEWLCNGGCEPKGIKITYTDREVGTIDEFTEMIISLKND